MKILLIFSFLISFQLIAQTKLEAREVLTKIHKKADLDSMKTIGPNWQLSTITVSPFWRTQDTSIMQAPLGSVHEINDEKTGDYLLKILSKEKKEFCNVSFISINRANLSIEEINKIEDQIISEFTSGKTVEELSGKYQRPPYTSNELGWFGAENMSSDFVEAVWNEPVNTALKVNLPGSNWYSVVFKTHANIEAEVVNCARIRICPTGCSDHNTANIGIADPKIIKSESEFPGGSEALAKFISDEMNYPKKAIKNKEEGTVIVSFIVETDGSITNIKIKTGDSEELNNEAIRLIELMPNWSPTISRDMKVRGLCTLAIDFELK